MGKSTQKNSTSQEGDPTTKKKASPSAGAKKALKAITAVQTGQQPPAFAFGNAFEPSVSSDDSFLATLFGNLSESGSTTRSTDLQVWSFVLSDHHRTTPEEERRAYLSGLEIPVFKHLERLLYAAKWGLDPGYVIVT